MARLTLDQINALIPNNDSYLQQLGITQRMGDDGSPVYYDSEGGKLNPGQIQSILGSSDMQMAGRQAFDQNGVIDTSFFTGLSPYMQGKYGNSIQSADDYMKYLYGGQGEKVGNYWVLPQGMDVNQTVNPRFENDSPDPRSFDLVKMGILALAGAGLTGMLPGTESIFGASGAGAGAADAAWGVNPATAGGAAGGMSQAELAAMIESGTAGTAGAGLEAAGLAGNGLSAAQMATLQAGGTLSSGFGGLNVADYIRNGFPGSSAPPTIPGAETGLMEAAKQWLPASGTALSRLIDGKATTEDYLQLAGGVGGSLLGAAGADAQANAYSDVADKYLGLGAPFRSLLAQSYDPNFSMANQPDFQNALDIGAQAAARATSAKVGNPVDNPGAYSEMQKYISGSLALPQLNTYRSQLGSFGQLGTNTAGTNDTAAAGQTSGTYNSLGFGLGQLTQPPNPFQDAMKGILSNMRN